MESRVILFDTDAVIEHFQKNEDVKNIVADPNNLCCISVITATEIFTGSKNKVDLRRTAKNLTVFTEVGLDAMISDKFRELMLEHSISHGLKIPDALIAATAIIFDLDLFTFNKKHFRFIKGLKLHAHSITPRRLGGQWI